MFFHFKLSSKNAQTLKKLEKFFMVFDKTFTIIKPFPKQRKKKFITILKSPHVNKTAQEQFEFRFYSKSLLLNSVKPLTLFRVIKQIQDFSFPGVKISAQSLLNATKKTKTSLQIVDPDNIKLNRKALVLDSKNIMQKQYIQLFDCYGESCLKYKTMYC